MALGRWEQLRDGTPEYDLDDGKIKGARCAGCFERKTQRFQKADARCVKPVHGASSSNILILLVFLRCVGFAGDLKAQV
jgi:hypothetical protein